MQSRLMSIIRESAVKRSNIQPGSSSPSLLASRFLLFFLLFLPSKHASSFDKAKIRRFSMNTRETFSFFGAKSQWADRSRGKAILKFVSWLLLYGAGGKTGVACLKLFEWNGKNFSNSIRIWRDTMIGSRIPFPRNSFFLPSSWQEEKETTHNDRTLFQLFRENV